MKTKIIIVISLLILVFLLFVINIVINSNNKIADLSDYIINEQYYYIKSIPSNKHNIDRNLYEYAVFQKDRILFKESGLFYRPNIENIYGIVRVVVTYGTNHKEIKYYNTYTNIISESFLVPSVHADYLSGAANHINLFASFDYDANKNTVLVVSDIFSNEILSTVHRSFISPTSGANKIVFLSDNIIFIDYDTIVDNVGTRNNKKEIIFWRDNMEPIEIISGN